MQRRMGLNLLRLVEERREVTVKLSPEIKDFLPLIKGVQNI